MEQSSVKTSASTCCCTFPSATEHAAQPCILKLKGQFQWCAVLEELVLDNTSVGDQVLPLLAPLAGTLEFVSVVLPPDSDGRRHITEEGVQDAMDAFAKHGGAPEFRI